MADNKSIGGQHYEMMKRCYNEKSVMYSSYGGRGIKVYTPWHDREVFKKWALENGYRPGLSLRRKDSSKDYGPDNCFFDASQKAKHGNNQAIKAHIKEYKAKKAALGLQRITDSPLQKTYYSMLNRCKNPNHKHYKHYGGRGISVCPDWDCKDGIYSFLAWAKESGWRPGLTLDRIDNDKGYSPNNCRWATKKEQLRNRRNTRLYEYKGFMLTVSEIAEIENIPAEKLRYRLGKGLAMAEAIEAARKQ